MKHHKRPNLFVYIPLVWLLKVFAFFKGQKIVRYDKITSPSFVISNHTSFYDFIYTTTAVYPRRVNYLAADKMFYDPVIGKFLRLARAIPKCLFQQDLVSIRATKRIIEQKGIVGIFPEGQISAIGRTNKPPFAIAKLIKKSKIDVFVVKHHNAYFVNPPWTKKSFPGPMLTEVTHLIKKQNIEAMTEDHIFESIFQALYYDAGTYNRIHRYKYQPNKIDNLENLIYQCPECGTEGLFTKQNSLHCNHCSLELIYDQYGQLNDYTIADIYDMEQRKLQDQINQSDDFFLQAKVNLESYREKELKLVGSGSLTVNKQEYVYEGLIDGVPTIKKFQVSTVPYLPSDIGINIQIYQDYQIYQFVFEESKMATKFVIVGEYLYQLAHHKDRL
jgi:1-acyl-sn-glycerol-3-phosphate acyltransferase